MTQKELNKLNKQLIKAAEHGDTEKVRELLDAGADINSADQWRDTVLMLAAANGRANTVKLLLDAGADINIQDKFGKTALMRAAARGYADTVKLLLDAGADIDRPNKYGWTALMQAALWGHTSVMELLIRAGADVDIKDSDSRTAFDMLKEDHPEQYDQWIRDTAVKHRQEYLGREDSDNSGRCTPDYDI